MRGDDGELGDDEQHLHEHQPPLPDGASLQLEPVFTKTLILVQSSSKLDLVVPVNWLAFS